MINNRRYIDNTLRDEQWVEFSLDEICETFSETVAEKFFACQRDMLKIAGKREKCDVSMITVRVDDAAALNSTTERNALNNYLNNAVGFCLRKTDQVFSSLHYNNFYRIILPGTPSEQIPVVIEKIKSRLSEREDSVVQKVFFSYEVLYSCSDKR